MGRDGQGIPGGLVEVSRVSLSAGFSSRTARGPGVHCTPRNSAPYGMFSATEKYKLGVSIVVACESFRALGTQSGLPCTLSKVEQTLAQES